MSKRVSGRTQFHLGPPGVVKEVGAQFLNRLWWYARKPSTLNRLWPD